jgi:hypothetical protein
LITQEKEKIMNKIKLILTVALAFVVLFAQAGNAAAAPLAQDPAPITGIITNIAVETDVNGATTVLVTLDNLGVIQTVRISDDAAFTLGLLLTLDPPVVDTTKINTNTTVSIPAIEVIPDAEPVEEEPVHPIAALLAGFFGEEASVIDDYHTDGFGFGVIAQALWMSRNLTGAEDETGDASLAGLILDAKENGDYSAFAEYFEDGSVPTNWGQFRKALLNKKENLGVVVSGQADESTTSIQSEHGNGNGQGNGNGNNNGNENGHGNGKNKNKDKGKDN